MTSEMSEEFAVPQWLTERLEQARIPGHVGWEGSRLGPRCTP